MKRIDLLISSEKTYSFEKYMALSLKKAFEKGGVKTDVVLLEEEKVIASLKKMEESPPDFLISFDHTPLLKNFCTCIPLPHFYWEVRSLAESLHTLQNPRTKMGFADRLASSKMEIWQGSLFFLPPAASIYDQKSKERPYDVAFLDDLIDTQTLEATWEEILPSSTQAALHTIVSICQAKPHLLPFEAIMEAKIESKFNDLLYLVEEYMKAKRFLPMLEKIEKRRVDVFGEHLGNNWLKRLKNGTNVHLHSSLPYSAPYTDQLDVLEMSKILVRDQYLHPDGCDEWVFEAIMRGCLVVTSHTPYLEEALTSQAPFFQSGDIEGMYSLIEYYLKYPKKREELLHFLQKRIAESHTFEHRAETILKVMSL